MDTETDRNGPKRTFVDTETDSLGTKSLFGVLKMTEIQNIETNFSANQCR